MSKRTTRTRAVRQLCWRSRAVFAVFLLATLILLGRAVQLQVLDTAFLAEQGDARHLRTVQISAHRGAIVDRHGKPLAVSTPVDSVWSNPKDVLAEPARIAELANLLGFDPKTLRSRLENRRDREFVYLRRHMPPDEAARVKKLGVPGVHLSREYRRYYPAGEVTAHLLGFTDPDDKGLEGLELAYDHWLVGTPGAKRVLRDRLGRAVDDIENVSAPQPGRTLTTSIDLRIQYLAYRELKSAIQSLGARSGSVIVLDVTTGEVLAMVNQPSYNPNDRSAYSVASYRNRAATDIFEPGSSFKPIVLAAALEAGHVTPTTVIDTSPGLMRIGSWTVQ
ncbi:MAG: penicillin-binding transpeptidase domain-containing protein, partial [Gammaproteobacteria bacterium]